MFSYHSFSSYIHFYNERQPDRKGYSYTFCNIFRKEVITVSPRQIYIIIVDIFLVISLSFFVMEM